MSRTAAEIAAQLEDKLTNDPTVTLDCQADEIWDGSIPEVDMAATRELDPMGSTFRFVLADGSIVLYSHEMGIWTHGSAIGDAL